MSFKFDICKQEMVNVERYVKDVLVAICIKSMKNTTLGLFFFCVSCFRCLIHAKISSIRDWNFSKKCYTEYTRAWIFQKAQSKFTVRVNVIM